jgi:acyl-CoA synthetase (AMP-forming)/AMP-acid ligase II
VNVEEIAHFSIQQLYAYLVATPGNKLSVRHLKAHLGATLPGYMVPSLFLVCDALPYTANGKVDKKALPSPDACDLQTEKVKRSIKEFRA